MAYQKIFVALDDSSQMEAVVDQAIEIAAFNKAELTIGHVVNSGPIESRGQLPQKYIPTQLKNFDELIAPYLKKAYETPNIKSVNYINLTGPVKDTLLEEEIKPYNPDLLICGARGLSAIKYALLGSVSAYLVKHVDCDVLVVKNRSNNGR